MMSSAKSFTDVIKLLKQRSPSVLGVLNEQYGRRLFSYALRNWGLSESDVEDILYETFYVLILKVESLSFASQAQFDGYIYSTFSNKLHEQFRKNRKANLHELTYSREVIPPPEEVNEEPLPLPFTESGIYELDEVIESPLIIRMQNALATLSPTDRDVLELWGQGYTYEEIGKLLDLDPTHMKVKCFRAKQKVINWFNANNTL